MTTRIAGHLLIEALMASILTLVIVLPLLREMAVGYQRGRQKLGWLELGAELEVLRGRLGVDGDDLRLTGMDLVVPRGSIGPWVDFPGPGELRFQVSWFARESVDWIEVSVRRGDRVRRLRIPRPAPVP